MRFVILIHQNVTREEVAAMPQEEQQALYAEWAAIREIPGLTPGEGLDEPATATTVRVQDGKTLITDGPFPQTKEALGGYLLLDADDLDAAIDVAARIPTARMGGAVEVRPVVQY